MATPDAITLWKSPGPVSLAYKRSPAQQKFIMGPIGGAKTTTSFYDLLDIAREMPPSKDGIAYARFPVLRDTIRNLNRTTLRTWQRIVPAKIGRCVGASGSEPGFHEFNLYPEMGSDAASEIVRRLGKGMVVRADRNCRVVTVRMDFFALGDNDAESLCRGIEGTAGFIDEGDLMHPDVYAFLPGRLGRYPERDFVNVPALDDVAGYGQLMVSLNAPPPDNHLYKRLYEDPEVKQYRHDALPDESDTAHLTRRKEVEFFIQPGGLSTAAENRQNLKPDYYDRQIKGRPLWYVRRMIHNEPCFGREGSLVLGDYRDQIHCAPKALRPVEGLPLFVSIDNGYRPAATVWQRVGPQWRGLAELFGNHIGPSTFGEALNRLLTLQFNGYDIQGTGDPVAFHGDPDNEETWFANIVARKTGVRFRPPRTNALNPRLDVVAKALAGRYDGDQPVFIISPTMMQTRAAFNGQYHYPEKRTGDGEDDKPIKNHPWSDLIDTVGYVLLRFGDNEEAEARRARGQSSARTSKANVRFNVFAR